MQGCASRNIRLILSLSCLLKNSTYKQARPCFRDFKSCHQILPVLSREVAICGIAQIFSSGAVGLSKSLILLEVFQSSLNGFCLLKEKEHKRHSTQKVMLLLAPSTTVSGRSKSSVLSTGIGKRCMHNLYELLIMAESTSTWMRSLRSLVPPHSKAQGTKPLLSSRKMQ